MKIVNVDATTGLATEVVATPEQETAILQQQDADTAALAAIRAPALADAARVATMQTDARAAALLTAFTSNDNVGLKAAVAARYPGLAGDALKAVQDIALLFGTLLGRS